MKNTKNRNFVYLYKSLKGSPIYVGYGKSVQRTLTHSGGSHNKGLKAWLAQNRFDLSIAGPYASEAEAKAVEAALISSMHPKFNMASGDDPKFAPVGVPPHLWDRFYLNALTLREIGQQIRVIASKTQACKQAQRRETNAKINLGDSLHVNHHIGTLYKRAPKERDSGIKLVSTRLCCSDFLDFYPSSDSIRKSVDGKRVGFCHDL